MLLKGRNIQPWIKTSSYERIWKDAVLQFTQCPFLLGMPNMLGCLKWYVNKM